MPWKTSDTFSSSEALVPLSVALAATDRLEMLLEILAKGGQTRKLNACVQWLQGHRLATESLSRSLSLSLSLFQSLSLPRSLSPSLSHSV
mmetsp:Transcript_22315/g.46863  ORF Transcript_22315/g.46863 Transcript_22315/m.46863 type:complete len:90 (+) Transcript_22315:1831-2100(+)